MLRIALIAIAVTFLAAANGTAGTLDRVQESGALKIGYREDAPPFSFENAVGEPAGYSVALCRAVAAGIKEQLKLDKLTLDYVPVTAENRFKAVADGEIDLLCGASTATLTRRETVDFSIATFIDGAGVLLRANGPKTFAGLEGRKVGVRAGTTTEKALRNTVEAASIAIATVAVKDHNDGLDKLLNDEIAAYFADRAILYFLMAGSGAADKLYLSAEAFTYEPYALALQKGDGDFRLAVDTALSRLYRSGEIATVFTSAFGANAEPTEELQALYRISALPE
ncbi:MAG: amino acid ABC transporter substrate-binding protein [Gammaproteobacteria bacterium]|jgi:polar amino acid transport system substrate-binding protein/glutamate/aspartate transport system substrate-binding protein